MIKLKSTIKLKKLILIAVVIALIIPQAACQKKKDPTPIWDEGFYLDTVCRITLYATDDELKMSVAKPILSEAFELIRRYETILSRTKEGSDIWRINEAAGEPVECSQDTIDLINKAIYYSELTNGAFDVSIGGVIDLWDFHSIMPNPRIPTSAELSRALRHVGFQNISMEGSSVVLRDPETQIDLGGIAKGFIADKVAAYLRTRGVTGAVVDLGGNLEVIGYKKGWIPIEGDDQEDNDVEAGEIAGGVPFVIGIKKPYTQTNEIVGTITAGNCSVVTSGIYERYIESNGKQYHHILSSTTGYPVNNDLVSVTVIGPMGRSADCDALSTSCLLVGIDVGTEIIQDMPDFGAVFIDKEGNVTTVGQVPEFKLIEENADSEVTEEGIKVD